MTFYSASALSRNPGPAAVGRALPVQDAAHRLLQRTAHLLASTPGGLRFEPGSRPWLVGLPAAALTSATPTHHARCA